MLEKSNKTNMLLLVNEPYKIFYQFTYLYNTYIHATYTIMCYYSVYSNKYPHMIMSVCMYVYILVHSLRVLKQKVVRF